MNVQLKTLLNQYLEKVRAAAAQIDMLLESEEWSILNAGSMADADIELDIFEEDLQKRKITRDDMKELLKRLDLGALADGPSFAGFQIQKVIDRIELFLDDMYFHDEFTKDYDTFDKKENLLEEEE